MHCCVLISNVLYFSLQALKRNNDHNELVKKAEQESSGQPANTDVSEIMETNRAPDIFLQPLRYAHANLNLSLCFCQ